MSKVSKAIRQELIEKRSTRLQVQKAVHAFNGNINNQLNKLDSEIIEYEEKLNKLEK